MSHEIELLAKDRAGPRATGRAAAQRLLAAYATVGERIANDADVRAAVQLILAHHAYPHEHRLRRDRTIATRPHDIGFAQGVSHGLLVAWDEIADPKEIEASAAALRRLVMADPQGGTDDRPE